MPYGRVPVNRPSCRLLFTCGNTHHITTTNDRQSEVLGHFLGGYTPKPPHSRSLRTASTQRDRPPFICAAGGRAHPPRMRGSDTRAWSGTSFDTCLCVFRCLEHHLNRYLKDEKFPNFGGPAPECLYNRSGRNLAGDLSPSSRFQRRIARQDPPPIKAKNPQKCGFLGENRNRHRNRGFFLNRHRNRTERRKSKP